MCDREEYTHWGRGRLARQKRRKRENVGPIWPDIRYPKRKMTAKKKNWLIYIFLMICYGSSVAIMVDVIPIPNLLRAGAVLTFFGGLAGVIVVLRKKAI